MNSKKANSACKEKYPLGTFKDKSHTQEHKENMSIIMSEKQSGDKNSQFGTMWITNGIDNKKVNKNITIPEGWYKGRKISNSKTLG